jgi:hypothetical protein
MGSVPDVIGFYNLLNPSSGTLALGLLILTEMSTRNLPGGVEGWPGHQVDSITTICEQVV